jgi:ubiquitin fusion degradation protein 1
LSGRTSSSQGKGKERALSKPSEISNWGQGQSLGSKPVPNFSSGKVGAGGASVPVLPQRNGMTRQNRSPTPDWVADDDEEDDVIVVDSD